MITIFPTPLLARLGSLKLALVVLLLMITGAELTRRGLLTPVQAALLPGTLFVINLTAAIGIHPTFRRQPALLVFHLALLALITLAVLSRLSYLKGNVELSQGAAFDASLLAHENGPWHPWRLDQVAFTVEEITVQLLPGPKRGATSTRVRWRDEKGQEHLGMIGDEVPLLLSGYRFYTSPNLGFSLYFTWKPHQGPATSGSVHLPRFPAREIQSGAWSLPGIDLPILAQWEPRETLSPERPTTLHPPREQGITLRVRGGEYPLQPGQGHPLPEGELIYHGMGLWMGFTVFHDWTMPWLLAACALAVAALGVHYTIRFQQKPWQEEPRSPRNG